MSKLAAFLRKNPVDKMATEEVIISKRLVDENGELLKATIKVMSSKNYNAYQKECMTLGKKGKMDFDSERYYERVVINHSVEPNFKSQEDIAAMECQTPEQYLNRSLLPGEIMELGKEILKLSGFDGSLEELKEKAKN